MPSVVKLRLAGVALLAPLAHATVCRELHGPLQIEIIVAMLLPFVLTENWRPAAAVGGETFQTAFGPPTPQVGLPIPAP